MTRVRRAEKVGAPGSWAHAGEKAIELWILLCGVSAIVFVFSIFIFVYFQGAEFLWGGLDWVEFFTSEEWRPTETADPHYGILALLLGSLTVTFVAMAIAVPFGLGIAVFVGEFCPRRTREVLKIVIELLAAIPSVVWGFIGLTILSDLIKRATGAPLGINMLNGGIILALMSLPIIVSIAEDALKAVPDSYREAAEALGATRWQMVYKVLFPAARNGILAAVLLGVGRAVGETMGVLMATGHSINMPIEFSFDSPWPWQWVTIKFLEPVRTLTATIAAELGETSKGSHHYQVLFNIGVLLFLITFAINLTADLVVRGVRKE
jgi:phosphate transport system permease protein